MYKLLIADDEKIIRESVSEMLDWNALNIEITACCKNGLEALDAIMDTAPDIVMTDICMPGLGGLELIEKIQGLDPRIQFVILTGYPEFEYARRALSFGVREFLLKPVSAEAIVAAIENVEKLLPKYDSASLAQLIAQLQKARSLSDREQARGLLSNFFSHSRGPEDLRHLGIALFVELHTQIGPSSPEGMSRFIGELMAETDYERMYAVILDGVLELLPARKPARLSLSNEVKGYVLNHLSDENLSLKFIAENYLYINVNYLSRTFTKQSGEKFSNYLNRTRVERAKKLLSGREPETVYVIAEAVGFGGNPQYFSQIFKKYTGKTPRQFMEEAGAALHNEC